MDKLAKVRAEVERRMLEDYNSIGDEQDVIAQGVCAGILHFIDSLQEEPVSEDLEVEVDRWYNNEAPKEFEGVLYADIEKCAKHFADWQKDKDQKIIKLAENHAMLAGRTKTIKRNRTMSRAEDRALERCPKSENVIEEMRNEIKRAQFVEGYHQAEKDLGLTWEDLKTLDDISDDVYAECDVELFDEKEYYQEVLKRFLEMKSNQ